MKKRWIFILAVLMIAATMFVACNSEVTDAGASAQPGEELVYATFGGGSKDLTAEYSFIDYTQLYWFYQAAKKDTYGTRGAVTGDNWAKVPGDANRQGLDGTVGPFAQGLWAFKLRGYEKEYDSNPGEGKYDISVVIGDKTYYYSGLVYSGESTGTGTGKNEVNLKYGNSNAIPVTVAPAGTTGKIALGTSTAPLAYTWYQNQGGNGALKLKVTVSHPVSNSSTDSWDIYYDFDSTNHYYGYIYAKNSTTSTDLSTGNYNLEFTVCAVETVGNETVVAYEFAKQSLSLTVFGSQTTYVKGDLVEGLFVENAHFVATDVASKIVIANSESVSNFVVDPTPVGKSVSGKQTTVSIPAGELTSGTQNNMTIEVVSVDTAQDVATAVDFVIEPEETSNIAVAAIDITLKQVTTTTDSTTGAVSVEETSVKNFAQPVTITTYISPNLTGVKVRYNVPANAQPGDDTTQPVACRSGDPEYTVDDQTTAHIMTSVEAADGSTLGYYPETGLLRFQTTHFSQFFVISDSEALNVTTGVYYSKFIDAINSVASNVTTTIKVLKDNIVDNNLREIRGNKDIILDLNENTLTARFDIYDSSLEIKNGTLDGTHLTHDNKCPIYLNGGATNDSEYMSKLTIAKDATITGKYAVILWESDYQNHSPSYGMVLDVYGHVNGKIWVMGNITSGNSEINIYSTARMNGGADMCIANQGYVTTTIYDGAVLIGGESAIEARSGVVNIYGGTFTSEYTGETDSHAESSGTTTKGAAFAFAPYGNSSLTVNIYGGTFTGSTAVYLTNPNDVGTTPENTFIISGGTFVGTYTGNIAVNDSGDLAGFMSPSSGITGGKYSSDPTAYVAPGYVADTEIEEGWWTVRPVKQDEAVASITRGQDVLYFKTLDAAVSASTSGDTINLLKDFTLETLITIPSGLEVTIDFNGRTVTYASNWMLKNSGVLTIEDSKGNGGIICGKGALDNLGGGTLTINGGSITASERSGSTVRNGDNRWDSQNTAKLIINDVTINTNNNYAIWNGADCVINGGTIISDSSSKYSDYGYCVSNSETDAVMIINGGVIQGHHGALGVGAGTVTINNVEAKTVDDQYSFYVLYVAGEYGKSLCTVNGGLFTQNGTKVVVHIGNSTPGDGGMCIGATCVVNGGVFEIGKDGSTAEIFIVDEAKGNPEVKGGTYSKIPNSVAYGYEAVDNGNGTWTVWEKAHYYARIKGMTVLSEGTEDFNPTSAKVNKYGYHYVDGTIGDDPSVYRIYSDGKMYIYNLSEVNDTEYTFRPDVSGIRAWNNGTIKTITITGELEQAYQQFRYNTVLENVVFGEGATRIPHQMFRNAPGLKTITIPATVTYIEDRAFYICDSLEEIVINGNPILEEGAIRDCSKLKTITFNGAIAVGNYVTRSCSSLETVYLNNPGITFTGTSQTFTHADTGADDGITIYCIDGEVESRLVAASGSNHKHWTIKLTGGSYTTNPSARIAEGCYVLYDETSQLWTIYRT